MRYGASLGGEVSVLFCFVLSSWVGLGLYWIGLVVVMVMMGERGVWVYVF